MSWKNILKKIISPIDFMEEIADKLNGKMTTLMENNQRMFIVRYGEEKQHRIELRQGKGEYHVRLYTDKKGVADYTDSGTLDNLNRWIAGKLSL